MTQSTTLNIENNTKETYIGNLISANVKSNVSKQSFSKLIDNINAKTNQIQTNIVSKTTTKTNTSSVNKKAITNDTPKIQNTNTNKKINKNIDYKNESKNTPVSELNKDIQNTKTTKISQNTTGKQITKNERINNNDTQSKIDFGVSTKDKLSDTNNSSPVNPSPVVSFDNYETQISTNEVQSENIDLSKAESTINEFDETNVSTEAISAAIVSIAPVNTIDNNTDDIISKVDDFAQSSSIDEDTLNVIEKIVPVVQVTNLSDETKQELDELLSEIENLINSKNDSDSDFVVDENEKIASVVDTSKDNKISQDLENIETKTTEVKNEIKSVLEKIVSSLSEKTDATTISTDEVKDVNIKTVENTDLTKDSEVNVSKTENNIQIKDDNIQDETVLIADKKEEDIVQTKDTKIADTKDKKEIETPKLQESKTKIEVPIQKETVTTKDNKTEDSNKNIISNDTNIKTDDKAIANAQTTEQTQNEEQNVQNEKALNQILEILKSATKDTVADNNEVIEFDSNIEINSMQTQNLQSTQQDTKPQIQTANTENIQNQINKDYNNNEFSQDTDKNLLKEQTNETFKISENDFETETVDEDFSVEQDIEIAETPSETNTNQNDTKNILSDKNLNMIEDMKFESNVFSDSHALSVSDEVAKIAINAKSSEVATPVNITQDNNFTMKNISFEKTIQQTQNLQTKMDSNNVMGQIFEKLQNFGSSSQRLTMILRPDDLGRLSIELTTNEKGLTTNILVQSHDVRSYIEKNIESLRQQLANAGINVNTIQIRTAGEEGATTYNGNQNNNQNQQQENLASNHQNGQNQEHNQKKKQEYISNADYDSYFSKGSKDDFSSVLTNTFNYILN